MPALVLPVRVICRTCGTTLPVRLTLRRIDEHTTRVTADPVDEVLAQLFTDAHAGPFTPRSGP